jgi:peroxisomal coenzyme A diphosphatase NUDT7
VVALLDDPSLLEHLKPSPDEVDHIFTHPLEAFLDPTATKRETLVDIGSEDWPYEAEFYVCLSLIYLSWSLTSFQSTSDSAVAFLNNTTYRMHRFRSSASPVKGLTADIMVFTPLVVFCLPLTWYSR